MKKAATPVAGRRTPRPERHLEALTSEEAENVRQAMKQIKKGQMKRWAQIRNELGL